MKTHKMKTIEMKTKTFKNRAKKLIENNGKIRKKNKKALIEILRGSNIFRPYYYTGRGRYTRCSGSNDYLPILEIIGIDFKTGNDAPRGGRTGYFIEITKKGEKQLEEVRAYYSTNENFLDEIFDKKIINKKKQENKLKAKKRNEVVRREADRFKLSVTKYKELIKEYNEKRIESFDEWYSELEREFQISLVGTKNENKTKDSIIYKVLFSKFRAEHWNQFKFQTFEEYVKN